MALHMPCINHLHDLEHEGHINLSFTLHCYLQASENPSVISSSQWHSAHLVHKTFLASNKSQWHSAGRQTSNMSRRSTAVQTKPTSTKHSAQRDELNFSTHKNIKKPYETLRARNRDTTSRQLIRLNPPCLWL